MSTEYARYITELSECFPALELRSWRAVQQGWDSVTFLVNDALIFRIARRPDVAARLTHEARLLPDLADALPLRVPRFTYVYRDHAAGATAEVSIVGYPAIPGVPIAEAASEAQDTRSHDHLAAELGAFLSALHAYPLTRAIDAGLADTSVREWRQAYVTFYGEIRAHIFPLLTDAAQHAVSSLWEEYLDTPAHFDFTPALIHGDLGVEHILYDRSTAHLTGVIDWGDARIGDPALDFTGIARQLGHRFTEHVHTHYTTSVVGSFWQRIAPYQRMIPFYEIRFGQYEHDAIHINDGLATLRADLARLDR